MSNNQQVFNGFNPTEAPLYTVSFDINKEQFKEMMMKIYNESMFHGTKPLIVGIVSIITFIFTYKFAYNSGLGQILLICSFTGALLGIILWKNFYFPSKAFKNQVERDYQNSDISSPFVYNFYNEGIEINTPVMSGRIKWQEIYMATIDPAGAIFGFIKNTPNGKTICKTYKNYMGIIMPFMFIENKQEVIDFLKYLSQANIIRMEFNKAL